MTNDNKLKCRLILLDIFSTVIAYILQLQYTCVILSNSSAHEQLTWVLLLTLDANMSGCNVIQSLVMIVIIAQPVGIQWQLDQYIHQINSV